MNLFFNSLFIRTDFFLANALMTDDFFFPDSYAGQSLWDSRHIYSDHSNPKEGPQKRLEKEINEIDKNNLTTSEGSCRVSPRCSPPPV